MSRREHRKAAATREPWNDDSHELRVFGDAVREMLGLEPIYTTDRGRSRRPDEERFYAAPVRCGLFGDREGRVPVRGARS